MAGYVIDLTPDDNDTILVTCPVLPEVTTFGSDRSEAFRHALDAVEEAVAARISRRDEVPAPIASHGPNSVALPALTVAKIALYRAAKEAGISKAELGRRLSWHLPQIDRLFDLNHASRLDQLERALSAVGKTLEISVRDAA